VHRDPQEAEDLPADDAVPDLRPHVRGRRELVLRPERRRPQGLPDPDDHDERDDRRQHLAEDPPGPAPAVGRRRGVERVETGADGRGVVVDGLDGTLRHGC
jgi:hypothetical protein